MWPGDQQSGGQGGGQQYPQGSPPQQPQGPYGPPKPYGRPGYQQPGTPPPGQQPGGQQPGQPPGQQPGQPSGPQPGYPTPPPPPYGQQAPNPYAQPGYQQQPSPGGYPTPQNWGPLTPGGPEGPPPGGRKTSTVAVAIVASLAVIAAIVVGAVYLTGGDKKDDAGKDHSPTPTATATTPTPTTTTPTPTPTTAAPGVDGGSSDSPRGAPDALVIKPVIPGWKVVRRSERNVAFDVPPDWTVGSEGLDIGFEDDSGKPEVLMGAPAYYKEDWCTVGKNTTDAAAVGSKGGTGSKSLRDAAETAATSWAYWAFQESGKGTVSKAQNSRTFHNSHGISGWQAQATMTNVPKANKCTTDGIAYTVAWLDPAQAAPTPVIWVLYAAHNVSGQVAQSVVDQIKSTIRPIKTK
jgi:hypothetical protein